MILPIKGIQKTSLVDYPGKVACTVFLGGCNFKCPYCQNRDLIVNFEKMETIKEEEVLKFLKDKKKWLDGVCITGGEPLLYDITDFIKKIKEIGLLVKLDTNGTNPKLLRKLINFVDYIAMDIKAPLEKYDNAARVNVDKIKIKESIELIKENKVDNEFRTTVVKDFFTEKDAEEIGKLLKGAKLYALQQFRPLNTLDKAFEKKHPYPKEEFDKFKKILEKYVKKVELRI